METKKMKLKNIIGRPINVLGKRRETGEEFEAELPKMNKWTSETYIVSPNQEVENLIKYGYLQSVE